MYFALTCKAYRLRRCPIKNIFNRVCLAINHIEFPIGGLIFLMKIDSPLEHYIIAYLWVKFEEQELKNGIYTKSKIS